MPKDFALHNTIEGYAGTDTQPNCDAVCWYLVKTPFTISVDQLAFFTMSGVTSNARV